MLDSKKVSIIYVLKVLEEYTDANNYLTQAEIIEKIKANYGLELERKSVASSLSLLQDLDYDIVKGSKGGFALISRLFDESEARFLIDAIFSSKSISGKQAKSLCDKISNTLSVNERKSYRYLVKSTDINRTDNKEVFLNIDIITEAIRRNKFISFKYLSYDEKGNVIEKYNSYRYEVSPCYLVNNFGKYYLLAYREKYNSVNTWRLDYIKDVQIVEESNRLDPKGLDDFKAYPHFYNYLNEHIYLFGGDTIEAKVELKEPSSLSYIKEWFGNNANIDTSQEKIVATIRCNEKAFYYWIMQYGEHMRLLSPQSMIDKIKNTASEILEVYK